jgi:hypothetical protein
MPGDVGFDLKQAPSASLDWLAGGERECAGTALAAFPDLPDGLQQVSLDVGKLVIGDLTHLALHLGFQQSLAKRRVVVQLRFRGGNDRLQRPLDAGDHQRIEEEHINFKVQTRKWKVSRKYLVVLRTYVPLSSLNLPLFTTQC